MKLKYRKDGFLVGKVTDLLGNLAGFDVWFPDPSDKPGADKSVDASGESNEWDNRESDETYLPYARESDYKSSYKPAHAVQEISNLQRKYR